MFKMMSGFPREKVELIKQNRQETYQVDALIVDSSALIEDTTIIIEENDFIARTLPNGLSRGILASPTTALANTLRYCNVLHSVHKLYLYCSRMPYGTVFIFMQTASAVLFSEY